MKPEIITDSQNKILYVDHLGYTLRTLLAAASKTDPTHRNWKISYESTVIGGIRIKTHPHIKKD
jgi:hypothetical protein